MLRKLIMGLASVFAIAAFAVVPAVAEAAHWQHCVKGKATEEFKDSTCKTVAASGGFIWQTIPNGKANAEKVKTHGTLTLAGASLSVICTVADQGLIWNIRNIGRDSITSFTTSNCIATPEKECPKPVEIQVAQGTLPWPSHLVQGPPIRDVIENIEIVLHCNGVAVPFEGDLEPVISETNGTAKFDKTAGSLESPLGLAIIEGSDEVEQEAGGAVRALK
jgi:hypothetical protein